MLADQTAERRIAMLFGESPDEDLPAIAATVSGLRWSHTRHKPVVSSLELEGMFAGLHGRARPTGMVCAVV